MRQNTYKNGSFTIYDIYFEDLNDLYGYLKKDPKVNQNSFPRYLRASIKDDMKLGLELSKAIEYIPGGFVCDIDNFLEVKEIISKTFIKSNAKKDLKLEVYGGIPFVPNVVRGTKDCMLSYNRDNSVSVRNIYFSLSYPITTKDTQIINRGIIALFIMDALEKNGNLVNLKTFQASKDVNEIIKIEIVLKNNVESFVDIKKCYFPLVRKEFFRRIIFRIFESTNVLMPWASDMYGKSLKADQIREIFEIPKSDIIIGAPSELGINGNDIYEDTINTIKSLNLEEEFDLDEIENFKKKVKKK